MSSLNNPFGNPDPPRGPFRILRLRKPKRLLLSRIVTWCMAMSLLIAIAGGITIAILLHSQRFHAYLIRTIEGRASGSLGVRVTLQDFALHLSALSVDLYGLTVDGAAPYQRPALLQVEHAQAGVRIVSLLRHEWYFDNIRIDRPVVRIIVDTKGVSNLPTFKSSENSSSKVTIFDLGVRHAILDHGEAFYNDRSSQIAADLHDLDFHAAFDNLLQKYTGRLAYSAGQVGYGSLRPVQHDFAADFAATRTAFNLAHAEIKSGQSQVKLSATLNNYVSPVIDGTYDLTLDGAQIGQILHSASLPLGLAHTTGSLSYRQDVGRSFLDSLVMSGELASARLDVRTAQARAAIERVTGQYTLANSLVTLRDLRANLLGGNVSGSGSLSLSERNPHSVLNAALREISLAALTQAAGRNARTGNAAVTGTLNADAKAFWGKTLDDLVANADATIDGAIDRSTQLHSQQASLNTPPTAGEPSRVSLSSALHVKYTAKGQQLALNDSYVRTPQTTLTMNGAVSRNSNLNVHLQANDLREVEALADLFIPSSADHPEQPLGLAGEASFQGAVRGSVSAPRVTGLLSATNLRVHGSAWKLVRANVDASPSLVSLQHAELDPASHGRIAFDASSELQNWIFTNAGNARVSLQASQLDIAEMAKLAGQQVPVTGTLAVNVDMHGTALNPAGNGSVQLKNATAYGQPIQSAKVDLSGSGDEVHGELSAATPAGNVSGRASIRLKEKTYNAQITSAGIDLAKIGILKQRNVDATGVLSLNASGQGSFDNPQVTASIRIPSLLIQSQAVSDIDLEASLANRVANATLTSKAVNTSIQAKAKVELTGDYEADASLDTQEIPLQPLVAVYAPDQAADLSGQTEVHATLRGPLKNKKLLEGHVTVPLLKLDYGSRIQLAAASPIHLDYKNGVIDLQRAAIRGTDTDVQLQGSIPASGDGPMSLLLQGSVNLELAQLFDPDVRSSGQLKLNINSNGPFAGTDIGGEIDIVDANFASLDTPVALSHGNGVLKVTKDRINIASFNGTLGGGEVTAQGGVAYRPKMQFDLGLAAKGVRMLYPQGMRERIDAAIRLTGSPETAVLGGNVNLADLSFTPAFDLNSFISQFSGGVAAPPGLGFSQNLRLNLAVHSTSDMNLVSRTLSVGGSANLQVHGTAADPVILGRVNLTSGDIILNGSRFVLNGGTVQFINPAETQPVVNLALATTIQQYNITLRFQGPVDQLKTQYSSDPALPSADIINLLAFGQTTEASAANPSTPANQAAESLVASQVSSQVTGRVSKIAGISQLSISPVLAGSSTQGPPGANITIQQRITGNLFVTFSSNVASTQSQTIQGQYQVSPRVAVSATRDPNGGFAFDTLIKKTW